MRDAVNKCTLSLLSRQSHLRTHMLGWMLHFEASCSSFTARIAMAEASELNLLGKHQAVSFRSAAAFKMFWRRSTSSALHWMLNERRLRGFQRYIRWCRLAQFIFIPSSKPRAEYHALPCTFHFLSSQRLLAFIQDSPFWDWHVDATSSDRIVKDDCQLNADAHAKCQLVQIWVLSRQFLWHVYSNLNCVCWKDRSEHPPLGIQRLFFVTINGTKGPWTNPYA